MKQFRFYLVFLFLFLFACQSDVVLPENTAPASSRGQAVPTIIPDPTATTVKPTATAVGVTPVPVTAVPAEPTETAVSIPTSTPPPPTTVPTPSPPEIEALNISFSENINDPWTLFSETAVVEHQDNGRYINAGAVIFHEGQYHMLNNEFSSWPASTRSYYYTSPDGETWTRMSDEPVFTSQEVEFTRQAALILTGFVEDDGTWVIYFHTFSSGSEQGFIGRATAPDPLGPWEVRQIPVLSPGGDGEWDDLHVMRANVLKMDEQYVMIYAGTTGSRKSQIGYATSPDGITWIKYDDPTTIEAPFAESDPIFQPKADWEDAWLGRPEVIQTEAGWVMLYEGGSQRVTGLAVSEDGINWARYENNPIFTKDHSVNNDTFFQGELHYHDDLFRYYLEVGPGPVATDIYLWTFPSPIGE